MPCTCRQNDCETHVFRVLLMSRIPMIYRAGGLWSRADSVSACLLPNVRVDIQQNLSRGMRRRKNSTVKGGVFFGVFIKYTCGPVFPITYPFKGYSFKFCNSNLTQNIEDYLVVSVSQVEESFGCSFPHRTTARLFSVPNLRTLLLCKSQSQRHEFQSRLNVSTL
jgi:hypothetical protein